MATLFGGFNSAKVDGGFKSIDKGVINEDAVRVVAFANPEGFELKFEKLVNKVKEWCRLWSQESIGLEFENDLFYIEQNSKFAKGGKVKNPSPDYPDFVSMQYKWGGYALDTVNVYVLLKPSQYYIDGADTTNKRYWYKVNGYPVRRDYAQEIANRYIEKYNLHAGEYRIGDMRRYEDGGQAKQAPKEAKKPAKFKDKVKAISKSLEGKKVPKRLKKDYGATYDKKESIDAAKRIAGSMAKKERKRYEI